MRKLISAMQVSVDGYAEGPEGTLDWVDSWEDEYGILDQVDLCILGSGMYDGYEEYWTAAREHPKEKLPVSGKLPTPGEVAYGRWAAKTPHIVVSRKRRPKDVRWSNTRVVSDLDEIRRVKQQSGKDIHVVGGPTLVTSLVNAGLVDEIRVMLNPVLLGGGKALFRGVTGPRFLHLESAKTVNASKVYVIYSVRS